MACFTARTAEDRERQAIIANALQRELLAEQYTAFEIVDLMPDDQFSPTRYSLWVRLRCAYKDRVQGQERGSPRNDIFTFEKLDSGGFGLVDSEFFDTLGRRQAVSLVADAILAAIVLLAAMTFWVWMGYEAFRWRPRSHPWRVCVLLLPVLGAVLFFLAAYVPSFWKKKAEPAT